MYSVVMMMVMSSTPEAVAFGGRRGGCQGCVGYSCGGGNACRGNSCGGDNGCGGGRGGFLGGRRNRGNGCCGCTGYVANSCGCQGYQQANCGCTGYMGQGQGCYGGQMMPAAPAATPAPAPMPEGKKAMAPASANIVVSLPADAKVYFDGAATNSASESRKFVTPVLAAGVELTYSLKAEVVRDGKILTATQVVAVRAGETTEVKLATEAFGN